MLHLLCAVLAVGAALLAQWPQPTLLSSAAVHSSLPVAMAHDTARDRLVLWTEFRGNGLDATVWEWDGTSWARMAVAAPPRIQQMGFDPLRQRVLALAPPTTQPQTLFAYDGHRFQALTNTPRLTAFAVDTWRNRVVALGDDQTWEWDGSLWRLVAAGNGPGRSGLTNPFHQHLAFDLLRGRCVTYLGNPPTTFEWDGVAWQSITGGPNVPFGSLVYDLARAQVVCVSYQGASAWDGVAWTPIAAPPAHSQSIQVLAEDPSRGRVYRLSMAPDANTEVFAYDGVAWSLAVPTPHPTRDALPTYDVVRDRVVLFAGRTDGAAPTRTLFEWDGVRWLHRAAAGAWPGPRRDHAQVYDAGNGETVVFGGENQGQLLADAWAWNGASWRPLAPLPAPRSKPAAAYDGNRGRVVALGGIGPQGLANDHLEWDGVAWRVASTPPFAAHDRGAVGHDPLRGRLVFQPYDRFQPPTTWSWDGSTWTAGPTNGPRMPGRSLAWNARRQRLESLCLSLNPTIGHFALDANGWTVTPVGQSDGGGVPIYDAARGQMLEFRGRTLVGWPDLAPLYGELGSACGRAGTAAHLTTFGPARLGDGDWSFDVRAEAGSSPTLLAIGFAPGSLSLGAGCTVVVPNPVSLAFAVTDAFGVVRHGLPLPPDRALRGVRLVAQAATVDAQAPLGFGLTQGVLVVLGD